LEPAPAEAGVSPGAEDPPLEALREAIVRGTRILVEVAADHIAPLSLAELLKNAPEVRIPVFIVPMYVTIIAADSEVSKGLGVEVNPNTSVFKLLAGTVNRKVPFICDGHSRTDALLLRLATVLNSESKSGLLQFPSDRIFQPGLLPSNVFVICHSGLLNADDVTVCQVLTYVAGRTLECAFVEGGDRDPTRPPGSLARKSLGVVELQCSAAAKGT
jgi:hypothetical protein